MRHTALRTALAVGALALVLGSAAPTASAFDKLRLGSRVADFTLKDENGQRRSLYQYAGNKAVVILFIACKCPYSRAFDKVMAKLPTRFRGVRFLAINSNKIDSVAEVKRHARKNGFTFPVLKDWSNKIADRFKARVTPEVFVISKARKLVYHGAIGNSDRPTIRANRANHRDLGPALRDLLAGRRVKKARTKAFGCTIKRI